MKIKSFFINYVIVIVFISCEIYSQNNITIDFCRNKARENYPSFSNSENYKVINELKAKNISNIWLPKFNLNGQATYQSDAIQIKMPVPDLTQQPIVITQKTFEGLRGQYKISLDITQNIYDGGASNALKRLNNVSYEMDLLQQEVELRKIDEIVSDIYFSILLLKKKNEIYDNIIFLLNERKKAVESAVINGVLQISDIEKIEVELLKNKQNSNEVKSNICVLYMNLSELLGINIDSSQILEVPLPQISDSMEWNRPELNIYDVQKNNLLISNDYKRSDVVPKLYAFAQVGYGRPGLNMLKNEAEPYYILGIGLKWNIWDWNSNNHERQISKIQSDITENKKRSFQQSLKIQLNNAKTRIEQIDENLSNDTAMLIIQNQILERSSHKLEQGIITSVDYLHDLNEFLSLKIQMETHYLQLIKEKMYYCDLLGTKK